MQGLYFYFKIDENELPGDCGNFIFLRGVGGCPKE